MREEGSASMQAQHDEEKKQSGRGWLIVLLLSVLLVLGAAAAYIFTHPWWVEPVDPSEYHAQTPTPAAPSVPAQPSHSQASSDAQTTTPLQDNPVDFAALQKRNDDVCAWIYLPMDPDQPNIDLPILQPKPDWDENYYLHKDIDRKYLYAGCVYIQQLNEKDFSDRVTVVYGHNMLDGTMFSNLPRFRDSKFFDKHEFFYIYTPGHILTYRIAAAIQFDTRHILYSFDFTKDQVYEDWLQNYVRNPKTLVRNVREDVELGLEDKLVILSTCLEHGASRYLIEGVLISDEPTN